jgi:hypothetical protein
MAYEIDSLMARTFAAIFEESLRSVDNSGGRPVPARPGIITAEINYFRNFSLNDA